jgi:hypothetical protein
MKAKERRREMIFDIVRNQMKNDDPPETTLTYQRLRDMGFSEFETMQRIGQCISVEIFKVMKFKEPFNLERYVENLKHLPEEPFEDQQ